jgi:hypothetical protein
VGTLSLDRGADLVQDASKLLEHLLGLLHDSFRVP